VSQQNAIPLKTPMSAVQPYSPYSYLPISSPDRTSLPLICFPPWSYFGRFTRILVLLLRRAT
jgi:hypothetical protein